MRMQAAGYNVLIELEKVEHVTASGIITASRAEHEREQRGQHKGKIINFGPLCYCGYSGIDPDLPVAERAALWGVKVGDIIECGRYAGESVEKEGIDRFMLIPDQKVFASIIPEEGGD